MMFIDFFLITLVAYSSAPNSFELSQSKMIEGKRLEAIQILNEMTLSPAKKNLLPEIKTKKKIYSEQFMSSQSFQKYQEAKLFYDYQHLDECIKELDGLNASDQNNIFVLRLKASCLLEQSLISESKKVYKLALQIKDDDAISKIGLSKISLLENLPQDGIQYLETIDVGEIAKNPLLSEQYVLQKAKVLYSTGSKENSIRLLKKDSEQNLDHIEVLYELATLYKADTSNYWLARRTYSLFLNRCKRLNEKDLQTRKLDKLLVIAQNAIEDLDKKLEVK